MTSASLADYVLPLGSLHMPAGGSVENVYGNDVRIGSSEKGAGINLTFVAGSLGDGAWMCIRPLQVREPSLKYMQYAVGRVCEIKFNCLCGTDPFDRSKLK